MQRCGWVSQDQLYIDYHDREWGVPETDGKKLFEMICLEGQQAGLSWIPIPDRDSRYRADPGLPNRNVASVISLMTRLSQKIHSVRLDV